MPFDRFVSLATTLEERRQAIEHSLVAVTVNELKNVLKEHEEEFIGVPCREKFLRLMTEHPHGSFYRAVAQEGVEVFYCQDAEFGVWVLRGSGIGPLDDTAQGLMKDAIALATSGHRASKQRSTSLVNALLIASTLLVSIGCTHKQAAVAPPPTEVLVATVASQDVPIVHEGVATLEGSSTANINAQVQGYLISRDYKEGNQIKKGDLLFQIDPRPFQAALDQAKGNLAVAQSNQIKAEADVARALRLFDQRAISAQERDAYINSASSTKANVQAAEAAVRQAEVNLGYTKIWAPIDGIVGIASAHVGDLVGPGTGTLTAISQVDPIKAAVNLGEQSFNEFITDHPDPDDRERYLSGLSFELLLGNGSLHSQKGTFFAEDRGIDPKTGAIRMELTFPNPGNRLRPGQFGRVRAMIKIDKGALVIPQEAVAELQGGQMVGVIGADDKVTMRPVKMGERVGSMWQVTEGLKPGEKVVVQGMMKVRPGAPVIAKDWIAPHEQLASNNSVDRKEH